MTFLREGFSLATFQKAFFKFGIFSCDIILENLPYMKKIIKVSNKIHLLGVNRVKELCH